MVATSDADRVVVWELVAGAGKEIASFDLKGGRRLVFSPDGAKLAVACEPEPRVVLCDVRTGAALDLDPAPDAPTLAFSGDGRRLVAGSSDRAVLWDVPTGKVVADHKAGRLRFLSAALDRTGAVIAVVTFRVRRDRVVFLDATTGLPKDGLTGPEPDEELEVNFAPDGKTVLLTGSNGVRWWDPAAGRLIRAFPAPAWNTIGGVRPQARFTPDGRVLVSHSRRALFRWDAATGRPLFPASQETGHTEEVAALGVSPDGTRVATLGWETGARVWDAAAGRQVAVLPASRYNEENLDFGPDGRSLFGRSRDGTAIVRYDLESGNEVARYAGGPEVTGPDGLAAFRLAPDGRTLRTVFSPRRGEDPRVVSWDVASGRVLAEARASAGGRLSLTTLSPDGRWLYGERLLLRTDAGPAVDALAGSKLQPVRTGVFSADSRLVALTTYSGRPDRVYRVAVVEVATGARVREWPLRSNANLAFHPDGRSLAVAESDGLAFVDLASGREFARRKAHATHPDGPQLPFARVLRYFPDGARLVTGHADTTALIWEAPRRPGVANGPDGKARAAAWDDLASADGVRGWSAVWALADDPDSVGFLRERLKAVGPLPPKEFAALLADLDANDFGTRTAAVGKLTAAGDRVVGQLRDALRGDLSAEQRAAAGRVLGAWQTADRHRPARAVAAVELVGTAGARGLLTEWARGASGSRLSEEAVAALSRLTKQSPAR
jgi:WD40 repeat protein